MASPFDVAFALGSDRAAHYLKSELHMNYGNALAKALSASRDTINNVKPYLIADTPYSKWLEALIYASRPTVGQKIPTVMQTAIWHDHKIETVLTSWTEMRHDTILMINGGGGSSCSFPVAYVEPVVQVYSSLAKGAEQLKRIYHQYDNEFLGDTDEFFNHFIKTMKRLESISRKELKGNFMGENDLKYMNDMLKLHIDEYTDDRLYNGWYPRLYWSNYYKAGSFSGESAYGDPLVADVYNDTTNNKVLETATGHLGVMLIIMEVNGKKTLFAGPASSFYSFELPSQSRMNDFSWRDLLGKNPPKRPEFAKSYWAD
jgi:hypothetical protein